jgi:hypothetical protein
MTSPNRARRLFALALCCAAPGLSNTGCTDADPDIIVLNDFESGDSWGDGWQVEPENANAFVRSDGRALKPPPRTGWEARVEGAFGQGFVDTFFRAADQDLGDGATGTLVSPDYVINRRYLNFLVDGGDATPLSGAPSQVEVRVDGALVEFHTGDAAFPHRLLPRSVDLADYQGRTLQVRLVDQSVAGFGFLLADQLVLSNRAGTTPDRLVADFDDAAAMVADGWEATGAFADPQIASAWAGESRDSTTASVRRIGDNALATCRIEGPTGDCGAPTGTVTSPPFEVTSRYLNFAMAGGSGLAEVGLDLLDDTGEVIASYRPSDCARTLTGDGDWRHLDLDGHVGRTVRLRILDEDTAGCGWVSVEHVYLSPRPRGDAAVTDRPAPDGFRNVSLPEDAFDAVVADFDDPPALVDGGWTATGAFAAPDGPLAWTGTTLDAQSARVGLAAVSTCELGGGSCDGPTGAVLTPPFELTRPYLNLLLAGGNGTANVGVELLDRDGLVIAHHRPASCGVSFIDGDDDWTHIDVTDFVGESVRFRLFDNESGACGFVSADHVFQSETPQGPLAVKAAPGEPPPISTGVDVADDAFDRVIGDFDNAPAMLAAGWTATGAFADPATPDAWAGTSSGLDAARVGAHAVSTCELGPGGCDVPTGTLTSPLFVVEAPMLSFLMTGGGPGADVGLEVQDADGETLVRYRPDGCDPSFIDGDDDWHHVDLSAVQGSEVRVIISDASEGACGFLSFDHLYLSPAGAGDLVGVATGEPAVGTNVTVAADALDDVVTGFEDPVGMIASGWVGTGAFAMPADPEAWVGTTRDPAAARVQARAIGTCEIDGPGAENACDGPTGTLTSPPFTVSSTRLSFLMAGGDGTADVGLELLDDADRVVARYRPAACAPSFIDGDDDWHNIDVSAFRGEDLRLRIFDRSSGACGFLSADHFYLSPDGRGDLVATATRDMEPPPVATNATVSDDAFDAVVADFEDPQAMLAAGWTASGGFADPADADAWVGTTTHPTAARIGQRAVGTCELAGGDCDGPTGAIESPLFDVTADFLSFLMAGGNGAVEVGLQLLDADGEAVAVYRPSDCTPSYIDGDADWHHIDVRAFRGAQLRVRIFDEESGGCGFVSADHLYLSDMGRGDLVATAAGEPPPPPPAVNVTLADDAFDDVVTSFEDPLAMLDGGWVATGDFADPADADAWLGSTAENPLAARVGDRAVSTCELAGGDCDGPMGDLTSPAFVITADFLSFLMAGGDGASAGIELLDDAGEVVARYAPASCDPSFVSGDDDWRHIDVRAFAGGTLRARLFDESDGACGFVSVDHLYLSDAGRGELVDTAEDDAAPPPLAPVGVTLAADAFDDVVTSFEDPAAMVAAGWVATGGFAEPADGTAWEGTARPGNAEAARVGERAVGTCELGGPGTACDEPMGTLTSPLFEVTGDFLSFLMAGGNGAADVGLEVRDADDTVLATYRPNACNPSFIDGDDDWRHIDVRALRGAQARVRLFDASDGGCGFVSADHLYLSDAGRGALVATAGEDVEPRPAEVNASAADDAFDTVLSSFEDPVAMVAGGWIATGAFADPMGDDAWSGTARPENGAAARIGERAVGTCEIAGPGTGCDGPTGTLTSPAFGVDADFLSFLMAGGNGAADVGLELLAEDDAVVATWSPSSCDPSFINGDDDWRHIDVRAFRGAMLRLRVYDREAGACGFISFDHFYLSAAGRGELAATAVQP